MKKTQGHPGVGVGVGVGGTSKIITLQKFSCLCSGSNMGTLSALHINNRHNAMIPCICQALTCT